MPGPSFIPKIVYNGITLNFTYPPEVDDGEQATPDVVTSVAIAGDVQLVYNNTKYARYVKLSLLTPTQKTALDGLFDWAKQGNSFDYYESDNVGSSVTYKIDEENLSWTNSRQTYSGTQSGFLCSYDLYMARRG
jgi:hypothetical protein